MNISTKTKYNKEVLKLAKDLQSKNLSLRKQCNGSLSDYKTVLKDYVNNMLCFRIGAPKNYQKTFQTKLYQAYGGEYCSLEELMYDYEKNGKLNILYQLSGNNFTK